jgi:DNA-binding CsgD family transcriptional regulator
LLRDQIAHRPVGQSDRDFARLLIALAGAILLTDGQNDPLEPTTHALQLVPDSDPTPLRAQLLSLHARAHASHGHNDEAARWANDALAMGGAMRLQTVVSEATTTLSIIDKRLGDPEASRKALVGIVASARAAGDVMGELRGLANLGFIHYEQARLEEAEEVYSETARRAAAAGRPWAPYGLDARFLAAVTAYVRGDWEGVGRLIDVTGQSPPLLAEAMLASVGLQVSAGRGELDALERLPQIRRQWQLDGVIAIVSGGAAIDLHGDHGDLDAAIGVHDDIVAVVTGLWQSEYFQARVRLSALVIGQLGDEARRAGTTDRADLVKLADEHLGIANETFQLHEHKGRPMGAEGIAWQLRAVAEHARLRWLTGIDAPSQEELTEAWTATVGAFESFGHAFETARSRARLAAVLIASGRQAEAKPLADAARTTARQLGAEPLLRELRTLGGAGSRSRSPETPGARETLTPRETQILGLVSAGRSNSEIAQQLYISAKTVSVHVSNILAKLGASGRTEAAALARRQGLLKD